MYDGLVYVISKAGLCNRKYKKVMLQVCEQCQYIAGSLYMYTCMYHNFFQKLWHQKINYIWALRIFKGNISTAVYTCKCRGNLGACNPLLFGAYKRDDHCRILETSSSTLCCIIRGRTVVVGVACKATLYRLWIIVMSCDCRARPWRSEVKPSTQLMRMSRPKVS